MLKKTVLSLLVLLTVLAGYLSGGERAPVTVIFTSDTFGKIKPYG